MRIFDDEAGVMNLDVVQTDGEILVVSQFTLQASTRKGNRPSYIKAAPEAVSRPLYERFTARVAELLGRGVATGEFGACWRRFVRSLRAGDDLDGFKKQGITYLYQNEENFCISASGPYRGLRLLRG